MKQKILLIVIGLTLIIIGMRIILSYNSAPDAIVNQKIIEKHMKDEYVKQIWSMDKPFIKVNPYETNELSAYLAFDSEIAYKWKYTVRGKTKDVDFTYDTDEFSTRIIIPIFGMYSGDNKVNVTYEDEEGNQETKTYNITTPEITDSLELDIRDEEEYEKIYSKKVLVDNYYNMYDKNGDIRVSGLVPYTHYGYLKLLGDKLAVSGAQSEKGKYTQIYEVNLMGRVNPDFYLKAPKNTVFHHDFVQANKKIYTLISPSKEEIIENKVAVYNLDGKLEKIITMDNFYIEEGNKVAADSNPNDIHINGIDYIEEENQLVLSSRSYSSVIGYDLDDKDVAWILDDPATTNLENVLTPIGKVDYTSGQHTPIVLKEDLPYFEREEGKYYISVFDNQSALDADGNEVVKDFESDRLKADTDYNIGNAQGTIYEIDLEKMTVKQVYQVKGDFKSEFTGSYLPSKDYQELYIPNKGHYQLFDIEGNLILNGYTTISSISGETEEDPFSYRARLVSVDDLLKFMEFH